MLPAFFYPPGEIKRVLLLGVGGGAVVQLLRQFVAPQEIVGIELNPVHIQVAKRFFKLNSQQVQLVQADALRWLQSYSGEPFDLIIDDLFTELDGEPVSVMPANTRWFRLLLKHLARQGMIVRNFIDRNELNSCAALTKPAIGARFPSIFQLTTSFNENYAGVYLCKPSSSGQLRKRLVATPGLNPALKTSRLRYRVRRLK
jgi:spermidine synthase